VKPYVIFNPAAGSAGNREIILKRLQRLRPCIISTTKKGGDAERFAKRAIREKCDYIIAAGGDGTVNEAVNGIATHSEQVRLGILPLGTGNDFARSLALPRSIGENIAVLRAGRAKRLDIVRVRNNRTRHFINVAAGGFSGLINEKMTPQIKRTWGPLAYVRGAAAALRNLHAYKAGITLDDGEQFSTELYNIVIANGRFAAAGLPIAPAANLSDGLLDLILIPKLAASSLALLAAEIVLGKHLQNQAIVFRRAKKIAVRARPKMWFNVDGELVGHVPAVFQVVPRALKVVVPK
jgi:diacylglycerol kinase (ATP)